MFHSIGLWIDRLRLDEAGDALFFHVSSMHEIPLWFWNWIIYSYVFRFGDHPFSFRKASKEEKEEDRGEGEEKEKNMENGTKILASEEWRPREKESRIDITQFPSRGPWKFDPFENVLSLSFTNSDDFKASNSAWLGSRSSDSVQWTSNSRCCCLIGISNQVLMKFIDICVIARRIYSAWKFVQVEWIVLHLHLEFRVRVRICQSSMHSCDRWWVEEK